MHTHRGKHTDTHTTSEAHHSRHTRKEGSAKGLAVHGAVLSIVTRHLVRGRLKVKLVLLALDGRHAHVGHDLQILVAPRLDHLHI